MAYNKIEYAGTVLIDLTADTVDAAHLAQGYIAHNKAGNLITGTMSGGGGGSTVYFDDSVGRVSNMTTMTSTGVEVTITEAGTYTFTWYAYASASSTTSYQTRLYNGTEALGTAHTVSIYSSAAGMTKCTETLEITANSTITVYASSATGSTWSAAYTAVSGLIAIKNGGSGQTAYKIDVCNNTVQNYVEIIANIDSNGNIDVSDSIGRNGGQCNNPFATPATITPSGTQIFRVSWDGDTGIDIQVNFADKSVSAKSIQLQAIRH